MNQYARTEALLGKAGQERLKNSRVAVFGIGGVGSFAAEALARAGIGTLDFFDADAVSVTNLNRQLIALHSTIGRNKAEVMAERALDIDPTLRVAAHAMFYLPENADAVDLSRFDYVVDAVDTLAAKLELAERAQAAGVPIVSAMGAGNKLDPTRLTEADIDKTSVCPLARAMRTQCRKRGIRRLKVVYSTEEPVVPAFAAEDAAEAARPVSGRPSPGSVSFVPSCMGLMLAGIVIRDLAGEGRA